MKSGTRALGIAESYGPEADSSTLAGAVVRADRVLDGASFGQCTVGGLDVTDAIIDLVERLDRPDVHVCMLGAVAPAWYNVIDLEAVRDGTGLPVVAVTFEASEGLESGLQKAFSGVELENRLERYRALPPRRSLELEGPSGGSVVYVRSVGLERARADRFVRVFTPEGGRPEPLRVARLLARAADEG